MVICVFCRYIVCLVTGTLGPKLGATTSTSLGRIAVKMAELPMNSAKPSEGSMRTSCPALRNGHYANQRGYQLDNPYACFVPVGPVTADWYSRIAAGLRAKGNPIPTNDVWIAAHAMETGADLASADRHFDAVDGIAWLRLGNQR